MMKDDETPLPGGMLGWPLLPSPGTGHQQQLIAAHAHHFHLSYLYLNRDGNSDGNETVWF